MTIEVTVNTRFAHNNFRVTAPTIPEAFTKIPIEAANKGVALVNDGNIVTYNVRVLPGVE